MLSFSLTDYYYSIILFLLFESIHRHIVNNTEKYFLSHISFKQYNLMHLYSLEMRQNFSRNIKQINIEKCIQWYVHSCLEDINECESKTKRKKTASHRQITLLASSIPLYAWHAYASVFYTKAHKRQRNTLLL